MFKYYITISVIAYSISASTQSSLLDYGPAEVTGNSIIPVHQLPPNILIDQEPNQVNALFADETCALCPTGQQTVAENFFQPSSAFNIDYIEIWGGYYPEDIPNTVDDFTIIIHADAGGQPGAVLWTRTGLQPYRIQTGVVLFGTHEYLFNFFIDNFWFPPGTGTYWVELYNNSTESGNFYWETGSLDVNYGFAGSGWYTTCPATFWNLDPYTDLSLRVSINWIPVELISFQASPSGSDVNLNWITATETNNRGFEVQRSNGSDFEPIAFVQGNGTTTEVHAYSFIDKDVKAGKYSYRLKQVNFDGTFEYSNVIEVEVRAIKEYALEQNYPNPFNPSTKITYSLAVDSKVKLIVYNLLGKTVATLVNEIVPAGSQEVTFDGINLNSGVYFYRIEATSNDGNSFVDIKKMILTK
jgi:hypothetical protein